MSVGTVVLSALLSLVVLFSIGVIAGAVAGWLESPGNWGAPTLTIAGAVSVGGFALLGLLRLRPWSGSGEPISPKVRKANNLLLLSGLLGALLGVVLAVGTIGTGEPFAFFSNGPMSLAVVIPVLAVWLLVVPVVSWQWHRSIDEHEAEAYKFGGIAALYLYGFLAPAWWLAWRGGLVPAPESMIIYLLVIGVFAIGWFWRRSR